MREQICDVNNRAWGGTVCVM